jgi:hypothetical protein
MFYQESSMHKQAYDSNGNHFGTFDGEYLYNFSGEMLIRVDGDEVYSLNTPCNCIGNFNGGKAKKTDGSLIFSVAE